MSESTQEHHQQASETVKSVPCAIITASDTRTPDTDESGQMIRRLLEGQGHTIEAYQVVKDDPELIKELLDSFTAKKIRVLIINGGTGISPRDNTFDAVNSRLEKTMPGFGEIFRMLSYQEVGAAAMLSRAVAGVYRGVVVISTPGSPNAVQLAMTKLILPELQHLAWEVAGRK
jgi:molybdopterin adenylyltransferase